MCRGVLTKRHFQSAAKLLSYLREGEAVPKGVVVEMFVEFFSGENGRFDRERFRAACVNREGSSSGGVVPTWYERLRDG